jgi:high-affinity nickel-transport protein
VATRPSTLTRKERRTILAMAAVVAVVFAAGAALLLAATAQHYQLSHAAAFGLGTGVLALTLGMRHAFDADHLAAIDNTTRALMDGEERPVSVGFFFALGHSSVVVALSVLLTLGIRALNVQVSTSGSPLHSVTGLVGTAVSGSFLYLIAALNVVVLWSVVRALADLRRGRLDDQALEQQLASRGLMNRFFAPVARRVDAPWKMYPLGVLFGLGFDTATEIALLVLSGSAVAGGLPFWAVLSLPLLFTAGMTAFDTADGCLMSVAYGWAFLRPVRKLYYNLVITALSVAVAIAVGTVELAALLGHELGLSGGVWSAAASFNLNAAGFAMLGLFVLTWVVALAVWRLGRIEQRFATAAAEG